MKKKIAHLADIHVFNSKKFESHLEVFENLYKQLKQEKVELCVIAGDLIDSKAKLSPEQIDITRNFLLNLTYICPVIITLGNHDLNLKNKERLDSISPIVHSLYSETNNPIHFLKHSGVYSIYNIDWCVWSCLDNQQAPKIDKNSLQYKIGVYHGTVKNCISDNGFILSDGIDIEEFKDCDRVFLGDIHKQQSFRNNEIAYSGSLIQTKITEPENGSYLIWEWDGNNYNYSVKRVENSHSVVTITEDNVSTFIPKYETQHVILKVSNKTKAEAQELIKDLKLKYKNSFEIRKEPVKKVSLTKSDIEKNKKIIIQTFENYIKSFVKPELIDKVLELDDYYGTLINKVKDFELGDFTFKSITLNNFLSFPPNDTFIDLDRTGIFGISGNNRVGKSTIFKAIAFCLFNSIPGSSSTMKKVINKNNKSKEAYVELILEKTGKFYSVKRTVIPKKKDGTTSELEFREVDSTGIEIQNKTGEKRQDTEKEIEKYFGSENSFEIFSLFSSQKRQVEFINCKNAEKLTLTNRFLGLQSYEEKEKILNEDIKLKKQLIQNASKDINEKYSSSFLEKNLEKLKSVWLSTNTALLDNEEDLKILEFKNRDLTTLYNLLKEELNNNKLINVSEESIKLKSEKLLLEIDKLEIERKSLETKKEFLTEKINEEIKKYKELYSSTYTESLKSEYAKLREYEKEMGGYQYSLKNQVISDVCFSCGQKINEEKIEKQKRDKELAEKKLAELSILIDSEYKKLEKREELKDSILELERELDAIPSKLTSNGYSIELKKKEIEENNNNLKNLASIEKAKEVYERISLEYNSFIKKKREIEGYIRQLRIESAEVESEIKQTEKIKTSNEIALNKVKKYTEELELLTLYKSIIHKDGFPIHLLKSKMVEINEQVNAIVSQVFDFEIEFSIEEEAGELNIDFFYPSDIEKNDASFASGAETFIINLCIKVGLSQVSEIPKLNSLLIDEGFGTLDEDSIAKLPSLFSVLSSYYKNIFAVSHIDQLKDLYETEIKLQKVNNYTEIIN